MQQRLETFIILCSKRSSTENTLLVKMKEVLFLSCFSLLLWKCVESETINRPACGKKSVSLASLEMAKSSIFSAKEHYPKCSTNYPFSNSTLCSPKEISFGYLDVAVNLINHAIEHYSTCTGIESGNKTKSDHPMDCSQILEKGQNVSGVYSIWLKNGTGESQRLEVYCDMETAGGGWTVIQRRGDFAQQEDFYRNWTDYKTGFGNVSKDFWFGNDNIFALSNQASYSVRFDLEDSKGIKGYAVYETFKIDGESSNYKLHISNYSGNVGDAMKTHNNRPFSTKDKGHDKSSDGKYCTKNWKGGWWYVNCYEANLNGIYRKGSKGDFSTVNWLPWRNNDCLTKSEIKLKRI